MKTLKCSHYDKPGVLGDVGRLDLVIAKNSWARAEPPPDPKGIPWTMTAMHEPEPLPVERRQILLCEHCAELAMHFVMSRATTMATDNTDDCAGVTAEDRENAWFIEHNSAPYIDGLAWCATGEVTHIDNYRARADEIERLKRGARMQAAARASGFAARPRAE